MNKAIIIAILAVLLSVFWSQYYIKQHTTQISADKLYHGQGQFFVSLLRGFKEVRPNETILFSPHSIFRALLLNYFLEKGEIEELLKNSLRLDWAENKADVSGAYESEKRSRANRHENQTVEFDSVEKLYFSEQVELE